MPLLCKCSFKTRLILPFNRFALIISNTEILEMPGPSGRYHGGKRGRSHAALHLGMPTYTSKLSSNISSRDPPDRGRRLCALLKAFLNPQVRKVFWGVHYILGLDVCWINKWKKKWNRQKHIWHVYISNTVPGIIVNVVECHNSTSLC